MITPYTYPGDYPSPNPPTACICLGDGFAWVNGVRQGCFDCPAGTRWLLANPQPGTVWADGTED